eukprot:3572139-Pyramimonas_sp.AAC.1
MRGVPNWWADAESRTKELEKGEGEEEEEEEEEKEEEEEEEEEEDEEVAGRCLIKTRTHHHRMVGNNGPGNGSRSFAGRRYATSRDVGGLGSAPLRAR